MSDEKSVQEQAAILSNLALGNQIATAHLAQLAAVAQQQAMSILTLAVVGKAVEVITAIPPSAEGSAQQATQLLQLVEQLLKMNAPPPAASPLHHLPRSSPCPTPPPSTP